MLTDSSGAALIHGNMETLNPCERGTYQPRHRETHSNVAVMPLYRFIVRHLNGHYLDEMGTVLADDAAARDHAERIVRELKESGDDDPSLTMIVIDESGSEIFVSGFR